MSCLVFLYYSPHKRTLLRIVLRIQIVPHSTLQLGRALSQQARQVLEIIPRRNAKLAHKVLCGCFEVAVVFLGIVVFGAAKVGVG
jgi:hypothetical protein